MLPVMDDIRREGTVRRHRATAAARSMCTYDPPPSALVVEPSLQDDDVVSINQVDEPVLLVDPT
jgi:hypothetical protein